MLIDKVKIKDGNVEIQWHDDLTTKKLSHTIKDIEPAPSFEQSLQNLIDVAGSICDLSSDYMKEATVIGLSISHSDGDYSGASISVLIDCSRSNSPICLNTPFIKVEDDMGNEFTIAEWELIESVVEEAKAYINGRRKQIDLEESIREKEDAK